MHYYKATIQYDGSGYSGFQFQPHLKTIQGELNEALKRIWHGKISTMGTSRTDTGVHAFEQIVKITTEEPLAFSFSTFVDEWNRLLPSQIRCLNIEECSWDFRPSVQVSSKEYRYFFTNQLNVSVGERKFVSNFARPLNFELMNRCVQLIKGEHDFRSFYSAGSDIGSTKREIFFCELSEVNIQDLLKDHSLFSLPHDLPLCFQFRIVADGFLKQMIRHLIAALWMVGSGKMSVEEFELYLLGQNQNQPKWKVAPANGLFLFQINR